MYFKLNCLQKYVKVWRRKEPKGFMILMKLNCRGGNTQQKATQKLNIKAIIKQWNLRPVDFRSDTSYVTLGGENAVEKNCYHII